MLRRSAIVLGAVICTLVADGAVHVRIKRQSDPGQGGSVIDSIFNIPITAIKQTAAAAQTFSPQNSQAIDSVLNIPVSTLEAVGNLVKATSGQRRQNAEELQLTRLQRRERVLAQRERQRRQRELLQQQRLKQQLIKRTIHFNNKDPFGLNTFTDILVGNHGFFGLHGVFGGHGGHGGHGGNGNNGVHETMTSRPPHSYEVHEQVDEGASFAWHGITAGIGSFHGSRPTTSATIQNKIAPKDKRYQNKYLYSSNRVQNAVSTESYDKVNFEDDPPLQNKIAPKSNKISFRQ